MGGEGGGLGEAGEDGVGVEGAEGLVELSGDERLALEMMRMRGEG